MTNPNIYKLIEYNRKILGSYKIQRPFAVIENMRTDTGSKQKLIVSLGSKLKIPKENRREVAQIVKERLTGVQSLFADNPALVDFADKIVKKIQTEGKWNSVRELVCKQKEDVNEPAIAEVFIDDVQHGYDREVGPVLIYDRKWPLA